MSIHIDSLYGNGCLKGGKKLKNAYYPQEYYYNHVKFKLTKTLVIL